MKTSEPTTASLSVPLTWRGLVCAATQASSLSGRSAMSGRSEVATPLRSQTTMSVAPASVSSLRMAVPAAPAPAITIRTSAICLPTTLRALVNAATVTMAVPCWSSWKTGMSSSSRSRRSTSKQRGAEMSSRLMPAKPGEMALTAAHDLVHVLGVQADREGVDVGEPLEQRRLALHHRHRGERADVAQAQHRRAVGDDGHRVALDGQPPGVLGVGGDGHADPRDAGGVDQRQVVAVADRHLGHDLELAAEVDQEGPVADLADLDAVQRAHLGDDLVGVLDAAGHDRDVDPQPLVARRRDVQTADQATGALDQRSRARSPPSAGREARAGP